jgi:hypothetical protein
MEEDRSTDNRLSGAEMNRAAEGTLVVDGAIKGFLLGVGSLAVTGYGIYSAVTGHVLRGLLIIFIGEPIWLFVADIATGIILAALALVAGFLGWGLKRREPEVESPSAWDA